VRWERKDQVEDKVLDLLNLVRSSSLASHCWQHHAKSMLLYWTDAASKDLWTKGLSWKRNYGKCGWV